MAKKQTIILTHGSSAPTTATTGYVQGEVLVQHGNDALNTALHTLDENGNWVTFPSKDWINTEIGKLEIGSVNGEINALKGRVEITEGEIDALQEFMTEVPGTYATKAELSGETSARETAISGLTQTVNTKAAQTDLNSAVDRITTAEGKINELETFKNTTVPGTYATKAELSGETSARETAISGLTQTVNTKAAQTDLNSAVDRITTAEDEIDALQTFKNTTVPGTYATKAELSGETSARETAISGLTQTVNTKAAQTDLNSAVDRISAIEGTDAGSSMRTVAAAEVKKLEDMLYGSGATEAIDTLKDVIDWIGEDNSGAGEIISDIVEIKGTISGYTSRETIASDINALKGRVEITEDEIDALQKFMTETVPGTYATKEQLSGETTERKTAISGLTEIVNTKAAQSGLTAAEGRITTAEGKITALETFKDETVPATYATKTELSGETSARETAINTLTQTVNTKAAQTDLNTAVDRISVIEGAYAKTITYSNGNGGTTTLNTSNNNIDLTQIIIDGGTY